MKEMIKKYKGTLICSVLVMLAEQTAEQQGYRDGHMDDTCYRVNL